MLFRFVEIIVFIVLAIIIIFHKSAHIGVENHLRIVIF